MEIWKDIVGYDGLYQVSNLGRVKSLKFGKERILKLRFDNSGYLGVMLSKNNIKKSYIVHRLVALDFIENPNNKPQVNHINGIKHDNRLENLEWVTCFENQLHAFKIGLAKGQKGEKNFKAKLTNKQVLAIREDNRSRRKIAKNYNVSHTIINDIKNGKTWTHI